MPPDTASTETELKLTLPGADRRHIAAQLAAVPRLAGLATARQRLKNIYHDTPAQDLRQHRAALRLRSLSQDGARPRWLQTLKTADQGAGALSRRGEWEARLRGGRLDPIALQGTPWPALDPQDAWFAQLAPCFETDALRTLRQYRAADGSRIEVALDVGAVRAGGERIELCELELELLQGDPDALFDLAAHIAQHLPLLPAQLSKAERGWRLVDGTTHAPRRARPPKLAPGTPLSAAAQTVLSEMLGQFVENLGGILHADGAELVHQARVGWRRWRSALWLFKPLLAAHPVPSVTGLRPLLDALGAARDLDVAALETLPPWADAFIAGDAGRARQWQALETAVAAERRRRRASLLAALRSPATGQVLIALERWLHALPQALAGSKAAGQDIATWAGQRTGRLHRRLERELREMRQADLGTPEGLAHQHQVRLLAKRTRYVLEALRTVLPRPRARRWQEQASGLQTRIGSARDLMLLTALLEPLGIDRAVLGFLRGLAAARAAEG